MTMNTQITRTAMMKIAVVSLVAASALLWLRYEGQVPPPSTTPPAMEKLATDHTPDDHSLLKPTGEDTKASKRELERALADMNARLADLRSQLTQGQHAQASS